MLVWPAYPSPNFQYCSSLGHLLLYQHATRKQLAQQIPLPSLSTTVPCFSPFQQSSQRVVSVVLIFTVECTSVKWWSISKLPSFKSVLQPHYLAASSGFSLSSHRWLHHQRCRWRCLLLQCQAYFFNIVLRNWDMNNFVMELICILASSQEHFYY